MVWCIHCFDSSSRQSGRDVSLSRIVSRSFDVDSPVYIGARGMHRQLVCRAADPLTMFFEIATSPRRNISRFGFLPSCDFAVGPYFGRGGSETSFWVARMALILLSCGGFVFFFSYLTPYIDLSVKSTMFLVLNYAKQGGPKEKASLEPFA